MKKIINLFLAVCMLAGMMVFGVSVQAAEEDKSILYSEDFNTITALTTPDWSYVAHGTIKNGELLIGKEKYPALNLPAMESGKAYELSYRIKFEQVGGVWKSYNDQSGAQMAFGSAVPGTGFSWIKHTPTADDVMTGATDINKWYTVKVEFCTDSAKRYTKWTLLNEANEVLDVKTQSALYHGEDGSIIPSNTAVNVNKVWFWNVSNEKDIHIDDIILKEVVPTAEEDKSILYSEDFNTITALTTPDWSYVAHGTIKNGELLIGKEKYPALNLPAMESGKAYELSYRIKFEQAGGVWKSYNDQSGAQMAFGSAVPGTGFSWIKHTPTADDVMTGATDINKWYTVKVEFCTDSAKRYTKWTLLNEANEVLDVKTQSALYHGGDGSIIPSNTAVNVNKVWFWNVSNEKDIHIDDIILKEVPPSTPPLIDENFDDNNMDKLLTRGWEWKTNYGTVTVEDGTLKLNKGAYIYFYPQKNNKDAYRVSYDIKVTGETSGAFDDTANITPNTALISYSGANYQLGAYNPLIGLSTYRNTFASEHTIPVTEADKWYTVTIDFSENTDISFKRVTLTDRETGKVIGSELLPYLEADPSGEMVDGNATSYYFWNRNSNGSVAYIDNVRFEKAFPAYLNPDTDITVVDYAGGSTKLTDGVTLLTEKINMQFVAAVTQESADAGITLTEKGGAAVPTTISVDGNNVTMTLSQFLKANTTYVLSIADTVTNQSGMTFEGPISVEFTTAANEKTIGGIKNLSPANLGELTPGGKVSIEAVVANPEAGDKKATIIAAFYSGNVLANACSKSERLSAGVNSLTFDITIPDMTNIDLMKVFLWSDLTGLVPYGKYKELLPAPAPTE